MAEKQNDKSVEVAGKKTIIRSTLSYPLTIVCKSLGEEKKKVKSVTLVPKSVSVSGLPPGCTEVDYDFWLEALTTPGVKNRIGKTIFAES